MKKKRKRIKLEDKYSKKIFGLDKKNEPQLDHEIRKMLYSANGGIKK